mmetsp:Transcript_7671/g.8375  ORF Transcript_7671/g.8375 Transcript_7671/m.8375 type:complete len:123 (+) Transcript_7671:613-981(+)
MTTVTTTSFATETAIASTTSLRGKRCKEVFLTVVVVGLAVVRTIVRVMIVAVVEWRTPYLPDDRGAEQQSAEDSAPDEDVPDMMPAIGGGDRPYQQQSQSGDDRAAAIDEACEEHEVAAASD